MIQHINEQAWRRIIWIFVPAACILTFAAYIAYITLTMPDFKHNVTGNDISFPQCDGAYPSGQSFGVVGVNGGVPTRTNPCLADQLGWAAQSSGDGIGQRRVQLYVNTANPGDLDDPPGWPENNLGLFNTEAPNPHGECDGSNSLACSWQYGWNRAMEAVHARFAPAARSAGLSDEPWRYKWWLDVETLNSWQRGSQAALRRNATALEGMVSYYRVIDVPLGIYSTAYQFGVIAGKPSRDSNLNGLDSWLAGGVDAANSQRMCAFPPLTPDGRVVMVQYIKDNFDFNYSCL